MDSTLKAVASFTESAWSPVVQAGGPYDFATPFDVLHAWNNDETVNSCGFGFGDLHSEIEWQEIDDETMAYRVGGKVLLVVTWEYDGAPDGAGYTITEWTMGTEAQQ